MRRIFCTAFPTVFEVACSSAFSSLFNFKLHISFRLDKKVIFSPCWVCQTSASNTDEVFVTKQSLGFFLPSVRLHKLFGHTAFFV